MARLASVPHPAAADARTRLAEAVAARLAQSQPDDEDRVEQVEVAVEPCDALGWLAAQPHAPKSYWRSREDGVTVAGVGAADRIGGSMESALEALQPKLGGLPPSVRYVGGLRFDPARAADPEWKAFDAARFVLPRVQLTVAADRATLAAHLVLPRDAQRSGRVMEEMGALEAPDGTRRDTLPAPTTRTDAPGETGWQQGIASVLKAIDDEALEKAVLARRVTLDFEAPLDPLVLAHRLFAAAPACTHLLVQTRRGPAFVGASPERLFRRSGDRLWSEAVAGTRPRSPSAAADRSLRDELLRSDKDQREHGTVRDYLRAVLGPFCTSLDLDPEASEMRLARGRHLYSGLRARLRPGTRSLDLLRALHPTPAVGGTPTDDALRLIRALEPFDRGWYAGAVGWIGRDEAEFAVGIRSGLVEPGEGGARLSLYAGAGIVQGSDPEAEWAEVEGKLSPFLHLFAPSR
ncbi:MAG: isochorismate synthase [Bacteroidota bacterium]